MPFIIGLLVLFLCLSIRYALKHSTYRASTNRYGLKYKYVFAGFLESYFMHKMYWDQGSGEWIYVMSCYNYSHGVHRPDKPKLVKTMFTTNDRDVGCNGLYNFESIALLKAHNRIQKELYEDAIKNWKPYKPVNNE